MKRTNRTNVARPKKSLVYFNLDKTDQFAWESSTLICLRSAFSILLKSLFAVVLSCAFADLSFAQKRDAELEWGGAEDVASYEIEVTALSVANSKPLLFKTKVPAWKGRLRYGKYSLRIRIYDARGVPSLWGEPSEFWVRVLPPVKKLPQASAVIASKSSETETVKFSWNPVEGAQNYQFELFDPSNKEKPLISQVVPPSNTPELTLPLNIARSYTWKVSSIMEQTEPGEPDKEERSLTVRGERIERPRVSDPETDFVRELSWSNPDKSEAFTYSLERSNGKGKWKIFEKKTQFKETKISFNEKYPGGRYRLKVQASAQLRPSSEIESLEFNVRDGDRSEEAANLMRLRESLEQPSKFYFITSYFVTNINYAGVVKERATAVTFDAIGGTGRVGLGYVFPKTKWSTFAIADLSGFNIRGQTSTFASAEAHAVWRQTWNVSLLRVSGGLFYKELPEASGYATSGTGEINVSKLTSIGPHVGFELLHPFTYKIGVQLNARGYMSVTGSAPNGEAIKPQASYQFSVLGSYRLAREVVGFAGYSFRKDSGVYAAKPGDSNVPGSGAARAGDENSISITGHYLNLILEYAF